MAERTLPTIGLSPIDTYMTGEVPAAYFEHVVTLDDTTERHCVEMIGTPTMIANANYATLFINATPAGTGGLWACPLFTRVTLGGAYVTGYVNAAEFELNKDGAGGPICDACVIALNSGGNCTTRPPQDAYIWLRDYAATSAMSNLFYFYDATIGTKSDTALCTTFADGAHITNGIRVRFKGGLTRWILCSSVLPSAT